jgi:predicted amidohydrolase YtcJ
MGRSLSRQASSGKAPSMLEKILVPWLHDQHSHASFYASLIGCPSLAGLGGGEAAAAVQALPEDHLSVVFGWHSAQVPFTPEALRRMPPAIIVNISMHGFALSGAAPEMLSTTQPELVEHWTDPEWCERNLPYLLEVFSRTAQLTPGKLEAFMGSMEAQGLGVVDDMLLPSEEAFQVLRNSRWAPHIRCWATPRTFQTLSPTTREALAGLKFFTDGALGSRTAGLRGEFLGGQQGLLLYRDEDLLQTLGEAHGFGKPLAIHAIGDGAIEQVLGVLERLAGDGLSFPLVRLEHVQFIDLEQARRAKQLGLLLSMQPNFNSDSQDYGDRLAPRWLEVNNPFRMLIDEAGFKPGEDLIFGSDGMPHGIEYALQWSLFPLYPGQRLTLEELVAGYGVLPGTAGHSTLSIDREARRVELLESDTGH